MVRRHYAGRNVTEVEASLGFKTRNTVTSNWRHFKYEVIRELAALLKELREQYASFQVVELQLDADYRASVFRVFNAVGGRLWPNIDGVQWKAATGEDGWLGVAAQNDCGGEYQKNRFFANEEDREHLSKLFLELCLQKHAAFLSSSARSKTMKRITRSADVCESTSSTFSVSETQSSKNPQEDAPTDFWSFPARDTSSATSFYTAETSGTPFDGSLAHITSQPQPHSRPRPSHKGVRNISAERSSSKRNGLFSSGYHPCKLRRLTRTSKVGVEILFAQRASDRARKYDLRKGRRISYLHLNGSNTPEPDIEHAEPSIEQANDSDDTFNPTSYELPPPNSSRDASRPSVNSANTTTNPASNLNIDEDPVFSHGQPSIWTISALPTPHPHMSTSATPQSPIMAEIYWGSQDDCTTFIRIDTCTTGATFWSSIENELPPSQDSAVRKEIWGAEIGALGRKYRLKKRMQGIEDFAYDAFFEEVRIGMEGKGKGLRRVEVEIVWQ